MEVSHLGSTSLHSLGQPFCYGSCWTFQPNRLFGNGSTVAIPEVFNTPSFCYSFHFDDYSTYLSEMVRFLSEEGWELAKSNITSINMTKRLSFLLGTVLMYMPGWGLQVCKAIEEQDCVLARPRWLTIWVALNHICHRPNQIVSLERQTKRGWPPKGEHKQWGTSRMPVWRMQCDEPI